jgi:uncharacterized cupredoxin-like copper-binding protein
VLAQGGLPGSGWKSGQQIQNVGNASANVVLTAYDDNGASADCGEKTIQPGASATFLTDTDCDVDAGFIGSAVASADQAIAAIVNVNNRGTGAAAGQYQGTDGADVANTISFPLVKANHSGRTTTFYVQNASTSPNDMTATFNINGTEYTKSFNGVPANAMRVFTPSDAGVTPGQGQVGSLEVVGTQPLAGSSLEHETTAAVGQNLQASKAFIAADGATNVFCPLYRNAHTAKAQTTGAQVQNVSNSQVTVEFTVNAGGTSYGPYTRNIAPGASETFYAPDLTSPTLPAGTVGSAVIESTGEIVAVVNDSGNEGALQRKTTYACFGSGSTTVNIPLAKEFAGGNTTGIQVQNVGSGPTQVTLEYKATTGPSLTIESTSSIAPGASITAYGVSNVTPEWQVVSSSGSMSGTVNGVVATASEDIVVIANESSASPNPSGQDTKNYEGFGQ